MNIILYELPQSSFAAREWVSSASAVPMKLIEKRIYPGVLFPPDLPDSAARPGYQS